MVICDCRVSPDLGAFTDGAIGTSKMTSGKCTVSIENLERIEYSSSRSRHVQERKEYVKVVLCLFTVCLYL